MMMDLDDMYPSLVTVKEEKPDFDEHGHYPVFPEEDKKVLIEPPKRGRTRSISKNKIADKVDVKAKLERSRQSARECRARKKLRYQYLEEVITETEKSIFALRRELDTLKIWANELDESRLPENLVHYRTSCVEKKLTSPFTLQQHHHTQIAQQKKYASTLASQLSQSPNSTFTTTGGGICLSPTTSSSIAMAELSLSPTGQLSSPYMMLGRFKRSPTNVSPTSASHSSVSPP